jgi:hypothetical protein
MLSSVSAGALVDCAAAPSEASAAWLQSLTGALARGERSDEIAIAFAEAGRRVGRGPLRGAPPAGAPATVGHWSADDAARAALLLAFGTGRPDELPRLVETLYSGGDGREKAAILRALPLLPDPAGYVALATDAGRSSDTTLFRAIACHNTFPSRHFSETQWNALLMKAVVVGAPIDEVVGLAERRNAELSRMALDYVDERESASRPVPPAVWDLLARPLRAGAVARLVGYASHSQAAHRAAAARALGRAGDERARAFLKERAAVEPEPAVAEAIADALNELNGTTA